jgi:response regulator RpfG family c-di-GMP phosphodiesterase
MTGPNILIVDDSAVIRKGLELLLKEKGAIVTAAMDGQQGFEEALSGEFDLIITDVDMPHLDGFGLCERIKETEKTRGLPVIILSSMDTEQDIDKGFRVGAAAYISKSDAPTQLAGTIDRVLEKSRFKQDRLILVVEDSETIRDIVKKGLEKSGFQVMTAVNGQEGLQRIKEKRPDLILSDIEMPVMNGVELCMTVNAQDSYASIPFVAMSTKTDRSLMQRMLHIGVAAYLAKPFNLDQLVITIERLLSDHFLMLLKDKERLESERRMMLAGITSLIEALEARDPYTRGHSESVGQILTGMATFMDVRSDEIEMLGIAGGLHDLGKIGVPDSILLKPGRLTDDEFAAIKQHPTVGANILSPIDTLKDVIPIVLHHHERLDGRGYPQGLKGTQIPFWARAAAVADTYHALTSNRPYRKGMDQDKAFEIMEEVRGTQLCPDCLDLFFQWISEAE